MEKADERYDSVGISTAVNEATFRPASSALCPLSDGVHPLKQPSAAPTSCVEGGPCPCGKYHEQPASNIKLATDMLAKFRHTAFRGVQLPAVNSLLNGEDVLALMTTGGGKSLIYQVSKVKTFASCDHLTPSVWYICMLNGRLRAHSRTMRWHKD